MNYKTGSNPKCLKKIHYDNCLFTTISSLGSCLKKSGNWMMNKYLKTKKYLIKLYSKMIIKKKVYLLSLNKSCFLIK